MAKIVILGAGESGTGAALLSQQKGFDTFVSDLAQIEQKYKDQLNSRLIRWEEMRHTEDEILTADEIVKSPGIPPTAPIMQKIAAAGIPVISEIEFAARYSSAKTICITGSNGKTTTAMLTYHVLRKAGLNVALAGNVGLSFARQVAEKNYDYYVLELSSFQLENMYQFKADIAILLNITPDHLDRYNYDFQQYIDAKFRITQNQTQKDAFIYWADDPVMHAELARRDIKAARYPFAKDAHNDTVAYLENLQMVIKTMRDEFRMPVAELALEGLHNYYNSMASGLSANILQLHKDKIRQALSDFEGVEHRLEYVATVGGVRFINDSKATNVNSCWYALQTMHAPTVLILGGTDKGNDYTEIEALVREKVKGLIFLGTDNSKLRSFFGKDFAPVGEALSMQEAVDKAYSMAAEGDTVMLSPCCASFDLFCNYEDRGRQFKTCVRDL